MLRNLPPVTKNILLLNILFYVVSLVLSSRDLDMTHMLGAHYVNSIMFKPYQVITHMFMHSLQSPFHIIFNMFLLVMFGGHLERVWGAKRYFIFYIASGLGAFALYNGIGVFQLMQAKEGLIAMGFDPSELHDIILSSNGSQYISFSDPVLNDYARPYQALNSSVIVGASGAIFGLLAGFAMLFPNTELMLLFPPIPIKAKYLIGGYLVFEVYNSIFQSGDQIAHLAHVGGAIVGIIFILVWKRMDRQNFY